MSTTVARAKVRMLLEDRPWVMPLKSGELGSDVFAFDFDPAEVASTRFKALVRDAAHDCGELAIVTFLQAKHYGKPLVLLPIVVSGGYHHKSAAYNSDRGEMTPTTLDGRSFGVRTYSQTTGVWARGILQNDYGTDLGKMTWVTYEDAHLAEHTDPPNCVRAPEGKKLIPMLLAGELDGGLLGGNMPDDPRLRPVIPDPEAAAKAWGEKHGLRPINHMFVVTKALCEARPDVVRAIYALLSEARQRAAYPFPIGFDGDWRALDMVGEYAFQQGVVPRRYTAAELFADARAVLG